MRVWLINSSEAVPTDPGNERLRRMALLAELLVSRGHEVVWWTSTFRHMHKDQRYSCDTKVDLNDRYRIWFLHTPPYSTNVSLSRLRNHRILGQRYHCLARTETKPDVVLCSYPTLELSLESARYGKEMGVPVVLDIRDLWPDVFLDLLPTVLRPAGRLVLSTFFRTAKAAFRNATAITGITEAFVDWGLRYAGRKRSAIDRCFPMAYSLVNVSAEQMQSATAFWNRLGISAENSFLVAFFGNIGRQFAYDAIIEAARILYRAKRNIRFVMCGNGDRVESLKSQTADMDNIVFPGWVGAAEIRSLMQMSGVGLAPYHDVYNFVTNIPNKPVEYLAGGLPVALSLSHGVLYELLRDRDCGFSYDADPQKLADTLCRLQDNPSERQRLSANAKAVYEEMFVAERVYSQMATYLEELAAAGVPPSK